MFKKIVSQLSLSPSAVSQLAFYARRLKQERVTRAFSAVAAVLIVGLQFATILAPPAVSNAASPNDIIYGGIVSKADLLNKYDSSPDLQALYARMGISRQDIVNTQDTMINSTDHSLHSMGRLQYAATDEPIVVPGHAGVNVQITYWGRPLYQFDTGANVQRGSNYEVLAGTRSSDGGYFAVMLRCGNIVFKAIPPLPAPPPPPVPTPKPTPVPTPTPVKPTMACVSLTGDVASGQVPLTVTFTGRGTATGQTLSEYEFNFGDNTSANQPGVTAVHQYSRPGMYTATLKVKGSSGTVSAATPACSFAVTVATPPAAFTKSKSALNVTQNVDATTQPAHAGDVIRYTLETTNVGGTAEAYQVVEHLEDVLEYADVVDAGGGMLANGVMTWPTAAIAPGATLTTVFAVTVKNPIPATPAGVSNPFSYDLRMDNVYGNTVQISIAPPLPKAVEAASTQLPQTGSGTGTLIVLVISALTIFFYLRNRQLTTEIRVLRNDYQGGVA